MKHESPSSSSSLQGLKTVIGSNKTKSVAIKKSRTKRSASSSPSIKSKKRPAATPAPPSKESSTNDDNNQYSAHELEMETKLSDYFQMNCEFCMHHFSSWSDVRSHYLDRHNVLKPFLRCCNRKYFLRSRIIEHIIWHVDPSSFWYEMFVSDIIRGYHAISFIYLFIYCFNLFSIHSCQKCSKKFHEKRTLTAHTLRHLEDEKRSFECHQCHKRFSRQHILNRHLSDVHPIGDPKFICQICKKKFVFEIYRTIRPNEFI